MVGDGRINDYMPWFRVFKWDGSHEDIVATLSESSGRKLKSRMFELYNNVDVRAVAVLSFDKSRVIQHATKTRREG